MTTTDMTTINPAAATAPARGRAGRVARLATEAEQAARVRELTTHPDVIALRVERVRAQVDALLWAGIVLGLAFTMVNVQEFAADGAGPDSPAWWVAWLLDPMVSLVLLAVLRAEQVTARYQVELPAWARRTKWLTFAATYVMNTWTSWGLDGGPLSWSGVVLHSVPPLVVFATAETGPGLRDRLTESVHRALVEHTTTRATDPATDPAATLAPVAVPVSTSAVHEPTTAGVREPTSAGVHEPPAAPVPARPARARRTTTGGRRKTGRPVPRRLLADYLVEARAALDTAHASGEQVDPSPVWCREVTGCSIGTSVKLAAALRTPTASDDRQEAA